MIGAVNGESLGLLSDSRTPSPGPSIQSGRKRRFNLGAFQRAKKLALHSLLECKIENDNELQKHRFELTKQEDELDNLKKKLHASEALMSKRKRKLEQLNAENQTPCTDTEAKNKRPRKPSTVLKSCSDKLDLSRSQQMRRRQKTLTALQPIHCGNTCNTNNKTPDAITDGLWTTLVGTASTSQMKKYISNSKTCMNSILPAIMKEKCKRYESSQANRIRSMRTLYDGGLIGKKKYTRIRNSGDIENGGDNNNANCELSKGLEIPKINSHTTLMKYVNSIDIGDVRDLKDLASELSVESVPGVYRPLKPFLLCLADLYIVVDKEKPCLHWFNNCPNVFYVAAGADGAPFGKDDNATAYLVSFLNLLQGIQSCTNNHLLLGANCEEDHPLLMEYTKLLVKEMEEIEGQVLKTERNHEVTFKFELTPGDQKWIACMSGELNNAATFFSSYANVNKKSKTTMGGTIGEKSTDTWKPWNYSDRIQVAKKVEAFKKTLKNPNSKERSKVTSYIASLGSRQEVKPPLGKYVNLVKAEPLHCSNNAWQNWFMLVLTIAMHFTGAAALKAANNLTDLPNSPIVKLMLCVKSKMKCGRLFKNFSRWFREKRPKKVAFSYRFTGLESRNFSWNFCYAIEELLNFDRLALGTKVKIHALALAAVNLRDAISIYSRVEVTGELINSLRQKCQMYFNTYRLFFGNNISPSIWTVAYAIPHHCSQLFSSVGYGLGLNSMQGREAKHIQLARYVENTCNVRKDDRWWVVFKHEFVSLIWLRKLDPLSIRYKADKESSYIPKRSTSDANQFCYCGNGKAEASSECHICGSEIMRLVKQSATDKKIHDGLQVMLKNSESIDLNMAIS